MVFRTEEVEEPVLSTEELEYFKEQLTTKKKEILAEARKVLESEKIKLDTNELKDEADIASITIENDLVLRLLDRSQAILREVDRALNKMVNGEYGYCEGTGEPIPRQRLRINPWVRYSVAHCERIEKSHQVKKMQGGSAAWL